MTKPLPAIDTPPKSGRYVEHDEFHLSDDEAHEGNTLGLLIDTEHDDDNGLYPTTRRPQ